MSLVDAPKDWPLIGDSLMSNFDHEVNQGVAQRMLDEQIVAKYPGWNFNADCWFADGQYHAAVYRNHIHRATMSADTPETLMQLVCNSFGDE